ncbi:MAG: NAD-dependent deacylase [Bacteroidales bacterium]|nr:NAD-dependent deacylase [Bacteroidales bacterium]
MTKPKIVFLTGAGISVESGLSTFRGNEGMWNNKSWRYYASVEGLYHDPKGFLDFYNWRRQKLSEIEPNMAHRLIAELEKDYQVTVVTQNVDNLHEKAGSTNILHLHGELAKVCSSNNRLDPNYIKDYPLTTPIKLKEDAGDGSQMRPFVVLFGEYVPYMEEAQDYISRADIFVVVGTSLVVYPAADLIRYADKDIPRYVIDPNKIEVCDALGFEHIQASASEGMKLLLEKIRI